MDTEIRMFSNTAAAVKFDQIHGMLAIHDLFPSHGEIPSGVWLERFGFSVILIVVVLFLPIHQGYKIAAGIFLPIMAYVSAHVYWGTVFSALVACSFCLAQS